MESGDGAHMSMRLVGSEGHRLGPAVLTPMLAAWRFPDGGGHMMVQRRAGVYDEGPGWRRYLVINPASRSRHLLAGQAPASRLVAPFAGGVSPDGQFAALVVSGRDGKPLLRLLDLVSCAVLLSLPVDPDTLGNPVWSPGGRWLFAVSPDGRVRPINPVTQAVQGLGASLPAISELAAPA